MFSEREIINFGKGVPMRLKSMRLGDTTVKSLNFLEIFLVLNGRVKCVLNDETTLCREDDVFVTNPFDLCTLSADEESVVVSLQIDTESLFPDNAVPHYRCNSARDNDKGKYHNLKRLIAELVKENATEDENNFFFNRSMIYSFLYELNKQFRCEEKSPASSRKYIERLSRIVKYIDENYRNALTLNELAEAEHLSVPYLSAFFEKHLGVNFQSYYNSLRLERAVHELLTTDASVENVAFNNGFTDPRSFVTLFKKKYDTLPSLYRKQRASTVNRPIKLRYDVNGEESYLSLLAKYLPKPSREAERTDEPMGVKIVNKKSISVLKAPVALKHTFKTFTSVGRAKELLFADVQQMLARLQREIGYEYVKFHGLLSDDMVVYEEDDEGNPRYSFVYVDKVLDFLISVNLKPLIQLSFMPRALAAEPEREVYKNPFIISPPKELSRWTDLVQALIRHLLARYGGRRVKSWLFCVWNEPDTTESLFGFKRDEDFYNFYKATYFAVKSVNKHLLFGSPSLLVSYNINRQWAERFLNFCKQSECVPDFMNIHYYDNDFDDESISQHRPAKPAHSRLNRDENSFSKAIVNTKSTFEKLGLSHLPIYLTEWNLTVSHRNLLNDTCFKSCYLAKNLLENYDELDSFGYWVLTDFIEETQLSAEQFHGGLGLFTMAGIPKPHYHVFCLMNKLGDRLIDRGEGYFITKSYGKIQIMLYNYEHFNHLFASGEAYDMTFTQRYTPFSQLGKMSISLELTDMPVKSCTAKEYVLNQSHGSAFDEWVRMGAPALSDEELCYLKQISVPRQSLTTLKTDGGTLSLSFELSPLEVRFIEISLT